ncbi:MAG: hypothetical protein LBK13_06310 [Spirochaetales bacterium]|nr:hypothetical protein [Spirochaetales bacterium]
MYQLYFLSIIINLLVGIVLARSVAAGKFPSVGNFLQTVSEAGLFRLVGGIAAVAVGILKLLLVTAGDVLILGDLAPALAGIIAGTILLFEYSREKPLSLPAWLARVADFLIAGKTVWGIVAVAAAVLHFFFNQALFL